MKNLTDEELQGLVLALLPDPHQTTTEAQATSVAEWVDALIDERLRPAREYIVRMERESRAYGREADNEMDDLEAGALYRTASHLEGRASVLRHLIGYRD